MSDTDHALPPFAPAALRASGVGTWETDFPRDLTRCCATVSAMFGFDPCEAAAGLPLERYGRAIHPDDQGLFAETVERVSRTGGLFAAEYRTVPRPGEMRWVMARGWYELDPRTGLRCARGIAIDITESKLAGHAEEQLVYLPQLTGETPLERAVTHALVTREAIDEIGGRDKRTLRATIDSLLLSLGRMLARAARFRN